jgi:hypothetical protein
MSALRRALNTSRQFGFDPLVSIRALRSLPRFISNFVEFKRLEPEGRIFLAPALADFKDDSGSAKGHYFWQDLICARWIFAENPLLHLDLGSRIDGFICHLLTFMNVEILDIRPLNVEIPGLKNRVIDAQSGLSELDRSYYSVSSLHSLEHFGLGRYGDPLDVEGHLKGLRNISEVVTVGGFLYVSFPIGKPRIEFNSQRVIHPLWPVQNLSKFSLEDFVLIPWTSAPEYNVPPERVELEIEGQCGLYKFKRVE